MEFPEDYSGGLDSGREIQNILNDKTNKKYFIITKTNKNELEKMINYLMNKDFILVGPVSCSGDNRHIYYTQTILKQDINNINLTKLEWKSNFLWILILTLLFKKIYKINITKI